jgi:hypothetical protein
LPIFPILSIDNICGLILYSQQIIGIRIESRQEICREGIPDMKIPGRMKRREFIKLAGASAAAGLAYSSSAFSLSA